MVYYPILSLIVTLGIAFGWYKTCTLYKKGEYGIKTKVLIGLGAITFGFVLFWLSGLIVSCFR